MAVLFGETGCALLAGFGSGYVIASVLESFLHQRLGHASPASVERWRQGSRLFRYFAQAHYAHHVVHHRRTFRQDHVTQFSSGEERAQIDQELAGLGAEGQRIVRSDYGLRLHGWGGLIFAAPLLPVLPLIVWFEGAVALVGVGIALALPPLLSHVIHPYMHMPHAHAVRQAPVVIGWLLRRKYFRAMARHHYVHHSTLDANFNLLLGGDRLRGCQRRASPVQRAEMRRLGLPVD